VSSGRSYSAPGARAQRPLPESGYGPSFGLVHGFRQALLSNAPHFVALVRAGALFANGKLVERPNYQDQQGGDEQAA
jgi:hypothetical protein